MYGYNCLFDEHPHASAVRRSMGAKRVELLHSVCILGSDIACGIDSAFGNGAYQGIPGLGKMLVMQHRLAAEGEGLRGLNDVMLSS